MQQAALIDYGVGNIFSMRNALEKAGLSVKITSCPTEIKSVDAVVLPGVGAFGVASRNIAPFKPVIEEVLERGTPILGSCLGMQLLFERSEEGAGDGLCLIGGDIVQFRGEVKIPHMGWNTLKTVRENELMQDIDEGTYFYFVHSYYPSPLEHDVVVAETNYGVNFPSVISQNNLFGTQFHPEKSGKAGASLLKNFTSIIRR